MLHSTRKQRGLRRAGCSRWVFARVHSRQETYFTQRRNARCPIGWV